MHFDNQHEQNDAHDIRRAIEALSEGFALFDEEDQLILCNSRFRESHPDLKGILEQGMSWSIFMTEVSRRSGTREMDQIDNHLMSGIEQSLTLVTQRPGDHWIRLGLHPIEAGGFVLTETDVTDAHAAEEMRQEADGLLRDILDACASRIAMTRMSDGQLIYQTPAWKTLFGDTNSVRSLYADKTAYSDLLAELLPTGSIDDFEATMLRANGTPFPARLSGRLVDFDGDEAVVVSAEDMTEVYRQRDEITLINQRLLDAIEALDQGFAIFDADYRLLMANKTYLDVNRQIASILVPGTHNDDIVKAAIAGGHEPLAVAWPERSAADIDAQYEFDLDGDRTFSASRRTTSDGGFVLAWRDVSSQKATERELARRRESAIQNEKLNALGQLLAGVAHELNNPLSVVVGYAMMLRDEVKDPETLYGVEKISNSAERCAKIVKTFLAMARQKPITLAPVSMNEIIETALDVASFGLRKSGAKVELELADDLPPVMADEDQIAQVFVNLLVNAEHALAPGGSEARLSIRTFFDTSRDLVVAEVADNGPGIPQPIRARIFEPFFTTKAVGEGTGVGLALSHRIMNSHEGSLELVDSTPGACFVVSLPRASVNQKFDNDVAESEQREGLHALIVEDEDEVARMIARMLRSIGATATIAKDGIEGLEFVATGTKFDFILCDLQMPGMSGLQFLENLENRWPHLASRLAFITGDSISQDAEQIRRLARNPLVEKPVSPKELKQLVQQISRTEPISQ